MLWARSLLRVARAKGILLRCTRRRKRSLRQLKTIVSDVLDSRTEQVEEMYVVFVA